MMRRTFRQALALTIAFALVASAGAWRQCTALQLAAASVANMEHVSHAAHHHGHIADHGQSDHHAMHHQPAPDDAGAPTADDHGCMKCCTMCTVANALVPTATMTVIFTVSTLLFSRNQDVRFGNSIAVDPGIPKRIA
jgi:hypothetical protein